MTVLVQILVGFIGLTATVGFIYLGAALGRLASGEATQKAPGGEVCKVTGRIRKPFPEYDPEHPERGPEWYQAMRELDAVDVTVPPVDAYPQPKLSAMSEAALRDRYRDLEAKIERLLKAPRTLENAEQINEARAYKNETAAALAKRHDRERASVAASARVPILPGEAHSREVLEAAVDAWRDDRRRLVQHDPDADVVRIANMGGRQVRTVSTCQCEACYASWVGAEGTASHGGTR